MKINYPYQFTRNEIPKRCRNPRPVIYGGQKTITLREFKACELPVAIREHCLRYDNTPRSRDEALQQVSVVQEYLWFRGQLWFYNRPAFNHAEERFELEIPNPDKPGWNQNFTGWAGRFDSHLHDTEEERLARIAKFEQTHILVDGVVYRPVDEPRYCVRTGGLGCDHGSTSLMIEYDGYNGNIPWQRYFNLLHREQAYAACRKVAEGRGDKKNLFFPDEHTFEILIPKAIKVRPKKWGGAGDPFINKVEGVVSGLKEPVAAGLIGLMLAFKGGAE